MSITSTINTNGINNTITTSIFLNGITLLDTLTYSNVTQQILFAAHPASTLSISDFTVLLKLYAAFNNILIAALVSPIQTQTTPFTIVHIVQSDDGVSSLNWFFKLGSTDLFDFTCTYPSGTTAVAARPAAITLSYAQWLNFIYQQPYLQLVVRNAYKI